MFSLRRSALAFASLVACSGGTTTQFVASDGGGLGPGAGSALQLPAGCTPQSGALTREYCEGNDTLVACGAGASDPAGCKRTISSGNYCCPTPPPPPATSNPAIIAFCGKQARCADGFSSSRSCEQSLETSAQVPGCGAAYAAMRACVVQPNTDPCQLASATPPCEEELSAYFACHQAAINPTCTPTVEASEKCIEASGHAGDAVSAIGFACRSKPTGSNECGTLESTRNGVTTYAVCCSPSSLFR